MKKLQWALLFLLMFIAFFAIGCDDDDSSDEASAKSDDDDDDDDDDDNDDNDDNDDDDNDTSDSWTPSMVVPIEVHPSYRGQQLIRGIIHLHSVYSHDACDSIPYWGNEPNWNCYYQLREAFCSTNQQYIMMSDHKDSFAYHDFPDVLLYQPDEGDELIYWGQEPVANLIHCEDGNDVILMAGSENTIMPIAIERMPDGTGDDRYNYFARSDAAVVTSMQQDLGAVVFVNHSEEWETSELEAIPIDGIEVYNLHANIDPGGIEAPSIVELVIDVLHFLLPFGESGHPDLILLTFLQENQRAMAHWDALLALRRTTGIMATDAHRNALPFPLSDGERADGYKRMMKWFANYILVEEYSAEAIKGAIAAGRMYGAFQVFGEPVGFDFYATGTTAEYEMGDDAPLSDGLTFTLKRPHFWGLPPDSPEPEINCQIIRVNDFGVTVVAESSEEDVSFVADEAGAYRAQVTVVPNHLQPWLGDNWDRYIKEYPLIYANPIYVVE